MEIKPSRLENLLRLPGADPSGTVVSDVSVLSCGCLVSEAQFEAGPNNCPVCFQEASLLKPIKPLRELYRLIESRQRKSLSLKQSLRKLLDLAPSESMDLVGLFCKLAREENGEKREVAISSSPETEMNPSSLRVAPKKSEDDFEIMLLGLNEQEEYNYSKCFPFHRKLTTFQIANKFKKLALRPSTSRYTGTSLSTRYDKASGEEISFVLITEKRWDLYTYRAGHSRPALIACGKLTGEYSYESSEFKHPSDAGLMVKNEFGGKGAPADTESVGAKLKLWVHLTCSLSKRFIVLAGTKGVVRVLNADPQYGDVGAPVFTYLTNFPIRCISIAPNENLIACGITARERASRKLQPFVILHQLEMDQHVVKSVHPITITIPYRDPLKVISFNASSTHLICSTVYEMRYFIIRLRATPTSECKKPMLIWSDMRVASRQKLEEMNGDRSYDTNLDDVVMDSEGITDIKFGLPGTNTIAITTSSWNNRPSLLYRLEGPSIDTFGESTPNFTDSLEEEMADDGSHQITDCDVALKVPEIGSSIYRVEFSPRGDSILFLDKSGRLFVVSRPNARTTRTQKKIIVMIGEAANAVRPNEAASALYSSDGGKVYVVDRRGLFQIFDFTKGIPGEDPEVIKCKIVSV